MIGISIYYKGLLATETRDCGEIAAVWSFSTPQTIFELLPVSESTKTLDIREDANDRTK